MGGRSVGNRGNFASGPYESCEISLGHQHDLDSAKCNQYRHRGEYCGAAANVSQVLIGGLDVRGGEPPSLLNLTHSSAAGIRLGIDEYEHDRGDDDCSPHREFESDPVPPLFVFVFEAFIGFSLFFQELLQRVVFRFEITHVAFLLPRVPLGVAETVGTI